MNYRVVVAGSRDFNDYELLKQTLDEFLKDKDKNKITIVSGAARGADRLGEKYAKEKGYNVIRFPAQWDQYGKSAGYRRNAEMAKYSHACVAFWDGESRGTKHMIDLAKKEELELLVVKF